MGLRFRSKPHPSKDLTPGAPQNFVAYAASSTVFVLTWQEDPNKTLPDDFDLDYSLGSAAGPWTPIPVNLAYTYNHTGQDVTIQHWWRLVAKHAGFASTSTITTAIAHRPVFLPYQPSPEVNPPTHTSPSGGDTIQFTAIDADGGALTYSLAFKYRSDIYIDPLTGLVHVPATAAGTNGNIIVRCTDSIGLYVETSCAISVSTSSAVIPWANLPGGPSWLHGTLNLYAGNGGTDPFGDLIDWRTWIGHQPDIIGVYIRFDGWANLSTFSPSSTAYLYPVVKSVPSTTPIILSVDLFPTSGATGGNKNLVNPGIWATYNSGAYDAYFQGLARGLKNFCASSRGIGSDGLNRSASNFILRLGWEMNGDWYQWSIGSDVTGFKNAWARVVGIIRTEIPGIWFDFSPGSDKARGSGLYVNDYAPAPSTFNVLSVSHHDGTTIKGSSAGTVIRTTPSTWTPHQAYLDRFLSFAKSLGKKMALTEWAAQMADCDTNYFVASQDPEWFFIKTWEFLYANRADIAWDTHFSPACCSLVSRQSSSAAVYFKSKWGA